VKHLRAWLLSAFVLWWLWMLLVGEWNHYEWIAASAAALLAAAIGDFARTRADVRAVVPRRWALRGWSALLVVFADFGLVMWALLRSLLRREVVRGTFRSHDDDDIGEPGVRMWRNLLANYSPNAYVVEIEPERGLVLLHDLIPRRKSEEPA
jgi:hypothetical protein